MSDKYSFDVKSVTKADIICNFLIQCTCSLLSKEYANMFQIRRRWENNKTKTHNQFGFYSTRMC